MRHPKLKEIIRELTIHGPPGAMDGAAALKAYFLK
jgi:hypothetical protein